MFDLKTLDIWVRRRAIPSSFLGSSLPRLVYCSGSLTPMLMVPH